MGNEKKIVVFVLRFSGDKNSAYHNRQQMLLKMLQNSFDVKTFQIEFIKKDNIFLKILNGIKFRIKLGLLALNVPKSTNDIKNVIFLFSTSALTGLIVKIICQIKKNKLIIENSEYPTPILKKNKIKKILYKLFVLKWQYKLYDGLFLMTDNLIDFYRNYVRKKCVIQKLPMTVDFARFENLKKNTNENYIAYAGSLSNKKDGVLYLINAFKKISIKYKNVNLKIAGGQKHEIKEILNIVKKNNLEDRVELLGLIDSDEIPSFLKNAKVLVLPRPNSLQAQGGFPTKLGEYLATGNPVIVTNVGEISKYLNDNEVFFINSYNIEEELIYMLDFVLSNYKLALKIGENGKQKAFEEFSIEINSKKIKNMINKVLSS